jgi:hypothetical protein
MTDDSFNLHVERHELVEPRMDANHFDLLHRLGRLRLRADIQGICQRGNGGGECAEYLPKLDHDYSSG